MEFACGSELKNAMTQHKGLCSDFAAIRRRSPVINNNTQVIVINHVATDGQAFNLLHLDHRLLSRKKFAASVAEDR